MKKAYVIGSNVSKSLSPHIFNYWFKKHKVIGEYLFKEISSVGFENELEKILSDQDVCGFNVTIPFKETVKKKIDEVDFHSHNIGAVNFVSRIKNKWVGQNTDWLGFLNSIEHVKGEINKKRAMVIGYGGASKAIIYALKKMGVREIFVFNRSSEKLKNINEEKGVFAISFEEIFKQKKNCSMIVNTTPANILGPLLDKKEENIFGYDLVYSPKETEFLSNFKKSKRLYGVSMLVHQAAPCFEAWYGVKPIIDKKLFDILSGVISK